MCQDIRPVLVRLREKSVRFIIVDIAGSLVKPFLYQALQAALLSPATALFFPSLVGHP